MKKLTYVAVNTTTEETTIDDKSVLKVIKDDTIEKFDEPTFAKVEGVTFHNGTIEVKVMSKLLANAPEFARGFLGVAFRINEDNTAFEAIYIRPTNGRSDDQLRRNHSTQYFSYPDYKFDILREQFAGIYESYADMGLDEWIDLKIEVQGEQAKLYVNNVTQPTLIVNDLKHGDSTGGVGLWVEVVTEGCFKDIVITPND